jgi:hypothetical protein
MLVHIEPRSSRRRDSVCWSWAGQDGSNIYFCMNVESFSGLERGTLLHLSSFIELPNKLFIFYRFFRCFMYPSLRKF